jgi:hypothetical protein
MSRRTPRIFFSNFLDIWNNYFWPTGAYTPRNQSEMNLLRKCILNPFQNAKKIRQRIISVHLNNLCSATKFCDEKTFCVACVKRTKNDHVNSNVGAPKFVFFIEAKKKVLFSRNFMNEHKMSRCITRYLFQNFEIYFLVMGASTPVSQSGFPFRLDAMVGRLVRPRAP